jgi:hypothetical protein
MERSVTGEPTIVIGIPAWIVYAFLGVWLLSIMVRAATVYARVVEARVNERDQLRETFE